MNTGVIDQFLNTFTTYIDSGFGLLSGEVAFLATTLVVIDVTIAAELDASRSVPVMDGDRFVNAG